MIRNLLYSLSLHCLLILVVYINFNSHEFIDVQANEEPITISFVSIEEEVPQPIEEEKPKEPEKPEIIEPEKEEPQKEPEKPEIIEPKKEEPKEELIQPKITEPKKVEKPKKELKKPKTTEPKKVEKPKKDLKKSKTVEPKKRKPKEPEKSKKPEPDKTTKETPEVKKQEKPVEKEKEQPKKEVLENAQKENTNIEELQTINLSARERFSVSLQIKRCYRKAILETATISKIPLKVKIELNLDGTFQMTSLQILNEPEYKESPEELEKALENVKKALKICSPIRNLPKDKYDIWKDMELSFDSNS